MKTTTIPGSHTRVVFETDDYGRVCDVVYKGNRWRIDIVVYGVFSELVPEVIECIQGAAAFIKEKEAKMETKVGAKQ